MTTGRIACRVPVATPIAVPSLGYSRRWVAVLIALVASMGLPGCRGEPVIPPGREAVLAEIFGTTGACTFDGGQIAGSYMTVEYACPTGRIGLRIGHAREAGVVRTQRFAIAVRSGTPPPGFLEALAAQVRSRESAFEWQWLPPEQPRWAKTLLHPHSGLDRILSAAVIVFPTAAALVGLALLLRSVLRLVRRPADQS